MADATRDYAKLERDSAEREAELKLKIEGLEKEIEALKGDSSDQLKQLEKLLHDTRTELEGEIAKQAHVHESKMTETLDKHAEELRKTNEEW